MATLTSPGISVTVDDRSSYAETTSGTIPLIVVATRYGKTMPDGVNTALGTIESNVLRLVETQKQLRDFYGYPSFVFNDGVPVHGDELNEYGLLAADKFLGIGRRAYILRADVNLEQLVPTKNEPSFPPPDGTHWINPNNVTGGIFQFDGTNWNPVSNFWVFTAPPTSADGADGDWGFDYTNGDGKIVYRTGGIWKPASNANLSSDFGANINLHVSPTQPTSADPNDFWYKTTSGSGGVNLNLKRFRASDGVWVNMTIVRDVNPPTPTNGLIWEDLSDIGNSGKRPLYVGTGTQFIPLPIVVSPYEPVTPPETGSYWFDDTITDFALYVEGTDVGMGNQWVPVVTTTVNNPSNTEKVISATEPSYPQEGSIWVDISTPENVDNFPVIKRWTSGQWIDISNTVIVDDQDPGASLVADGTYWLNTGETRTRNIVKEYDPNYVPKTVVFDPVSNAYTVVDQPGNHWKPATGRIFGRRSVRYVVVRAMQAVVASNQEVRSESINFDLVAAPGYPELYDEMVSLVAEKENMAFVVADTPKFMTPNPIAVGREVTAPEWAGNTRNVTITGEDGFASGKSKYAGFWYPWCITSNLDGSDVFSPPSTIVLWNIAYNDMVANVWDAPAGTRRGVVTVASSVGYLSNDGTYVPVNLSSSSRDTLYENDINPIAFFPGRGLIINGQKTWAASNTAMDRINVARLVIKIKRDVKQMMFDFLFEKNDAVTRRSVRNIVERYLTGIMANGGLYDFAVRCDETNNTPDVIDRNELKVEMLIKPTKTIEFIYVDIGIVNTGAPLDFTQ